QPAKENYPVRIKYKNPIYPKNPYQMGYEGWVIVIFDINNEGIPVDITVLASDATSNTRGLARNESIAGQFEKSVVRSYSKARYEAGKPIDRYRAIVRFGFGPPSEGGSFLRMQAIITRGNLPRSGRN
ncbi:MAG: hypothetical protein V3R64_05390, partial [Sphingomonadales bacterium]